MVGDRLPYPDLDINSVRRFVQARANARSVRAVAGEIGIGHQSLEKFLDGAAPYARNRTLICTWYVNQDPAERLEAASGGKLEPAADLSYHLEVLIGELEGPARVEALMRISRVLSDAYARMGTNPPAWLSSRR